MRRLALMLAPVALCTAIPAHAQAQPPLVDAAPPSTPPAPSSTELNRFPPESIGFGATLGPRYSVSRWAEDWSFLRDPTKRKDPFDPLKFIALDADGDTYLTLSAQQRVRYETYSNRGLRDVPSQDNLLIRTIAGADLNLGQHVRVFGEVASGQQSGSSAINPNQRNDLIVQQLFAEVKGEVAGSNAGIIYGRQHFLDGPIQFVSTRENTNIQASLQGVRAYARWSRVRIDAFSLRDIDLGVDAFDDHVGDNRFEGVLASFALSPQAGDAQFFVDPFFFHASDPDRSWGGVRGREKRNFYGVRSHGDLGRFEVDWVGTYQSGSFDGRKLRAWSLFADQSVALGSGRTAPRIGFHADAASGGGAFDNGTLRGSDTLFGVLPYLSDGLSFGLINVIDVSPTVTFTPAKAVTVRGEVNFLWRTDNSDAVYAGTKMPYLGTQNVPGSEIGQQARLRVAWVLNPHITLAGTFEHVFAGPVLKGAGFTDSTFTATQILVKF